MTRVSIDRSLCTGQGRCFSLAPDVFDADDQGFGIVLVAEPDEQELVDDARMAADTCPESAIAVTS
jgi:ferredoxin